jgi:hypothetical protein
MNIIPSPGQTPCGPTTPTDTRELRAVLRNIDPATLTRADVRAIIDVLQQAMNALGIK